MTRSTDTSVSSQSGSQGFGLGHRRGVVAQVGRAGLVGVQHTGQQLVIAGQRHRGDAGVAVGIADRGGGEAARGVVNTIGVAGTETVRSFGASTGVEGTSGERARPSSASEALASSIVTSSDCSFGTSTHISSLEKLSNRQPKISMTYQ